MSNVQLLILILIILSATISLVEYARTTSAFVKTCTFATSIIAIFCLLDALSYLLV